MKKYIYLIAVLMLSLLFYNKGAMAVNSLKIPRNS